MAIYLDNGVILPNVPDGVLDTHPYAAVGTATIGSTVTYGLIVTKAMVSIADETLSGQSYPVAVTPANGYQTYTLVNGEWVLQQDISDDTLLFPIGTFNGTTYDVLLSNYDIEICTADPNGSVLPIQAGMYIYGSEIMLEEEYKLPTTLLVGLGAAVRGITGVKKRYTPSEMVGVLSNIKSAEGVEF